MTGAFWLNNTPPLLPSLYFCLSIPSHTRYRMSISRFFSSPPTPTQGLYINKTFTCSISVQ